MRSDYPVRTAEFMEMVEFGRATSLPALVLLRVLAKVTCSTIAFWQELASSEGGPQPHQMFGELWYDAIEVDAWFSAMDAKRGQKDGC